MLTAIPSASAALQGGVRKGLCMGISQGALRKPHALQPGQGLAANAGLCCGSGRSPWEPALLSVGLLFRMQKTGVVPPENVSLGG